MSRKTNKKTVAKPKAVAQQPSAETQEQVTKQVTNTEGQTTEQETEKKEEPKAMVAKTTTSPLEGILERCRKMYPTNKVFYITSDMQVFLEGGKNMAELHQSTLKDGKLTVKKYK